MRKQTTIALVILISSVFLTSCGAKNDFTKPVVLDLKCQPVEVYLAGFLKLVEDNKLENLKNVLQNELTKELQAELIAVLLDVVKALPSGTLSKLTSEEIINQPSIGTLGPLVIDIIKYITGALDGTSRYDTVGVLQKMLVNCSLNPTLKLLLTLLENKQFTDALLEILGDSQVKDLLGGLNFEGSSGKKGFVALVRNLLVSISKPGFEITDVKILLGQFIDISKPPFSTFFHLLETLLDPVQSLPVLQDLAQCLLDNDSQQALLGFVYDLLTLPSLNLTQLFSELKTLTDNPDNAFLFDVILQVLKFYSEDDDARSSLKRVLLVILREDIAVRLLPDLVVILESGALGDLLTFAHLLATKCSNPPPITPVSDLQSPGDVMSVIDSSVDDTVDLQLTPDDTSQMDIQTQDSGTGDG